MSKDTKATHGSPPHTRGKGTAPAFIEKGARITPAHAGKSLREVAEGLRKEDHPRTRGEKKLPGETTKRSQGSPPHTRGKVEKRNVMTQASGITPAHAGKSISYCFCYWSCWDHPRTRGEKPSSCCFRVFRTGSPPHTRGKDQLVKANVFSGRITPAHAGKSVIERNSRRIRQDHPRTRGEKSGTSTTAGDEEASPPHTRGKVSPP